MDQIRLLFRKRIRNVLKPFILREVLSDVWKFKPLLVMITLPLVFIHIDTFRSFDNNMDDHRKSTFIPDISCPDKSSRLDDQMKKSTSFEAST